MKSRKGLELKAGQYFLDGAPFFLYSGELHYFRVAADQWKNRLQKAKQLGLNTIASYIPWIWHEPEEGNFDFTGKTKPERNLVKFLELIDAAGLKFFARPGPVTHGEIKNGGLPQWLLEKPNGICVRRQNGTPCDCIWLPSFYNPQYREKVGKRYEAVIPILEKFQAERGGPVVQTQLDNEIHMQNWLGKQPDYNPEVTLRYQQFLREKYSTLEILNKKYKSQYLNFEEIQQPDGIPGKENWQRLWDWASYYRDHYAGYFEFLAKKAMQQGLKTAFSANIAQFLDFNMYGRGWESIANSHVFNRFSAKVPEVIFGGAFQMRHLDFENFHDIFYTIEIMRSITAPGIPTHCAELQVGVLNDRPRIYSSDVELNLKTCVAHGLNGVNGYMMFGGKSPDEIQMRGNYHEWQAPVDTFGKFRKHAEPVRDFGRFLKSFGPILSQTSTLHDLTLAFDGHYYKTEFLHGDFYGHSQNMRNLQFFDGSARLLALLGFSPELLDLENVALEVLLAKRVLWVYSQEFMSRAVMEKLVAFVRAGGKLILNPAMPRKDEHMSSDDYLMNQLGLQVEAVRPGHAGNYYRVDDMLYVIENDMTIFSENGCEVILWNHEHKPCIVRQQVGKGEVLAIGFGLYHQYDYLLPLIESLTQRMSIQPELKKSVWDIHAVMRLHQTTGWLYIANFHDTPKKFSATFSVPGEKHRRRFPSQGEFVLPNRSAYLVPINLPITEQVRLLAAECEVLSYRHHRARKQLVLLLHGQGGRETCLEFKTELPIRKAMLQHSRLPIKIIGKLQERRSNITLTTTGSLDELVLQF